VLGETGVNFGAGMSGGVAYVYDPDGEFPDRANTEMVSLSRTLDTRDRELLTRLVTNHASYTGSARAKTLLENWDDEIDQFVRVFPDAYADVVASRDGVDVRTKLPPSAAHSTDESSHGVQTGAD
jgi:glutamate synthase (ferredoxin)